MTGTSPARSGDLRQSWNVPKVLKAKNVGTISRHRKRKRRFFASPLHIMPPFAPFHAPIRGGHRGGARLSKMDCSDTTQSLQVVPGTRFKMLWRGPECRSRTERTAASHAPTKAGKARSVPIPGRYGQAYPNKERSGCGIQFC